MPIKGNIGYQGQRLNLSLHRSKHVKLGHWEIHTPILWLGHDLSHQVRVWTQLESCPGVLMNIYQLLIRPRMRKRAISEGLQAFLQYDGPVFLDSGGFSFQQNGKCAGDPVEMLKLYQELQPQIGAILDVPLNPSASKQSNHERWQLTLSNTTLMFRHNSDFVLAPVLHSYDLKSIEKRHAELRRIIPNPKVLCIGSLVPLLKGSFVRSRFINKRSDKPLEIQRWQFIAHLILSLRQLCGESILHVFGVGSLSTMYLLFLLGVDSVDSVSWRLKAGFGAIQLPGVADRFLVNKRQNNRTRRLLESEDLEVLKECQCPVCNGLDLDRRIEHLSKSFNARAVHNAYTFISETDRLREESKRGQILSYVEKRLQRMRKYSIILKEAIMPQIEQFANIGK